MRIFKSQLNLDFMSKRKLAIIISATMMGISIISMAIFGFNKGIDFTGGTLFELEFVQAPDMEKIRDSLGKAGYKPTVQRLEKPTDVLIRIAPKKEPKKEKAKPQVQAGGGQDKEDLEKKTIQGEVMELLRKEVAKDIKPRRVEFVGAQVGEELRDQGGIAVLLALGAILIYVWLRFEKRFALGAIFALIHDVTIVVGVFSLLQLQFDLTILAAVLAVIGYSLNDTIVVFDRIRENFRKMRKSTSKEVINRSLNQTLARTLMTSITTLIVLLALFFLGGKIIEGFSIALIIGVMVGTYSSIYIASVSALLLGVSKEDLIPVDKEGEQFQAKEY